MVEIAVYRRTLVRRCYGGNLDGLLEEDQHNRNFQISQVNNLVLVEILIL